MVAAKTNLKLRYSLLKHYYSLFISQKGLGSIFNTPFLIFPLDDNNYEDVWAETQFLLGNNLMATPILDQGITSREVYFTSVNWYNLYTGEMHKPGKANITNIQLTDKLPLFLREGTMILMQNTDNVMNTKDLNSEFHLVIGFSSNNGKSVGGQRSFEAKGSHISISDYADETKVSRCLAESCLYNFVLAL